MASGLRGLRRLRCYQGLRKLKKLARKSDQQEQRPRWLEAAVKYLLRTRCSCEQRALGSNLAERIALDYSVTRL